MWLTRNGGPLFGTDGAKALVRADFALNAAVVAFFEQRAREFGIGIDVASPTVSRTYDVEPQEGSEKNLHIALLKRYHGLPHGDQCSDALLQRLASRFMVQQTKAPNSFGFHGHREIIQREMRAILFRLHQRGDMVFAGLSPPAQWDAPWIDHVHTYCHPTVNADLLALYRQYGADWTGDPIMLPRSLRHYLPRQHAV
jgi:hypothetical protein